MLYMVNRKALNANITLPGHGMFSVWFEDMSQKTQAHLRKCNELWQKILCKCGECCNCEKEL